MNKAQIAIIATELGIFAIAVFAFWAFTGKSDAIGYGILYIWGLMPLVSFITSLAVGLLNVWGRYGALWPALCAILTTLLPCVTFDAAHALHFGSLVAPDLTILIGGFIVSYIGFAVGIVIRGIKKNTGER